MPAGYEAGLRVVEHYLGRGDATKQARGIFPSITQQPTIRSGRVIRNRDNIFTGTAAQPQSSITTHGVRPEASFQVDAVPEDLLPFLMSFFHNVKYTEITQGAQNTGGEYITPFTEVGQFEFGMPDARPDNVGAVVGTYDPAAGTYGALVSMSDAYTIGLEFLYGHGDLGDTNNGISIDNFMANMLRFSCESGPENVLTLDVEGFGRNADELADFAAASWGPGTNGALSTQSVFGPDTFSIQTMDVNGVDKITVYEDWMDSVTVEMTNGIGPRDPLGAGGYEGLSVAGRPGVSVNLGMSHVAADFITAMVNNQSVDLLLRFSNGANETLDLVVPNMLIAEEFAPDVSGVDSDITVQVPLVGVIDPEVASPLVEVDLKCTFDVRTNSYFLSTTLADASTYTGV